MSKLPDAVFVVDTRKEKIAVDEARKLKIPVIGIVDTNSNPDDVDYLIPGNDDALRSIRLFLSRIADAVVNGRGLHDASNGSPDTARGSTKEVAPPQAPPPSAPPSEAPPASA